MSKVAKWILGVVVAAVAAFITGKLTGLFADLDDRLFPPTPITVNVDNDPGCPLVFTAPAPDAQRALDTDHGREIDKRRAGGIDGDTSRVELTVQGNTDKVVNITDMRVLVDKRSQPAGGFVIGECGGLQDVHVSEADLDQQTNEATAVPQAGRDNFGAPIPAALFPLRVTASDPQVFELIASTETCDCSWTIELSWTVGGKSGTITVDDHGDPFRTIGTGDRENFRTAYIDPNRQFVVLGPDGLPLK